MTIGRSGSAGTLRLAALAISLLAFAAPIGTAYAQSGIDQLQLPRGTRIPGLTGVPSITTGADANTYVGIGPPTEPFANALPAGVVRTTEPTEYYVRLYTPGSSNPNGPWIMRASTVRGLTPEQLRDRFALPFLPTYITNVLVPSGTCLLSGIAGPILGNFTTPPPPGPWGNGGAQQTRLVAGDPTGGCRTAFLPLSDYINQRPIGANALWYAPVVGGGNPGAVAVYLDHLAAPVEYSDLYGVYNTLDVLNDGTPTTLRPALREITGEIHAAGIAIVAAEAERVARAFADHARGRLDHGQTPALPSGMTAYATAPSTDASRDRSPLGWWAAGGGDFGRIDGNDARTGYRFDTGRAMVGHDFRPSPRLLAGGALSLEQTGFDAGAPGNSGSIATRRAGAYGAAELGWARLAISGLLSWDHFDTTRSLPTFARSATASYDGWSAAVSADASHVFSVGGVLIEPLAGVSAVEVWRPGFSEAGAGVLSLLAASETEPKLATRVGASVTQPLLLWDGVVLSPWARAFWAHDFLNTQGELTAALAGAAGPPGFTILSAGPDRNSALLGAGLTLGLTEQSTLTLAYDGALSGNAAINTVRASATIRW